jgi:hypothetical protein
VKGCKEITTVQRQKWCSRTSSRATTTPRFPPATVPLVIVSFLLTPQDRQAQTPGNFPVGIRSRGRKGKSCRDASEGETACSICRAGLCNASIRSVRHAATGCVRLTPLESCAAIAAPRSEMFRRHSAPACGCVPARWVVTVHRVARQDGSANRASDSQGRSSRPHRDEPSPPMFPLLTCRINSRADFRRLVSAAWYLCRKATG